LRNLDLRAYANDVAPDFSRPGKPTDNGFIEALRLVLCRMPERASSMAPAPTTAS
jgi:putative transposase